MASEVDQVALVRSLVVFAGLGVASRIAPLLEQRRELLGSSLCEAVVAEIPAFSTSGNPQVLPDLERHAEEHVGELIRLLGGGDLGDFDFVRAQAQRGAEQHFPLEATLHAYRCIHKLLSHWLHDAAVAARPRNREPIASAVADIATEYTNAVCTVFAAEYVARVRMLAEAEGDRRTELLSLLVSGYDESDERVTRLLKRAGYLEQRQSFCVALAQSADPLEMEQAARSQRIVEAIIQAVAAKSIRALVGVRNNVVTAVFSDVRRASGWTAPQAELADRVRPLLLVLGPAVLIGLSSDQPSTSFIPRGLQQAAVALDFANVAERAVFRTAHSAAVGAPRG